MEMKDEVRIPAPRERVYAALNDPEILKATFGGKVSVPAASLLRLRLR